MKIFRLVYSCVLELQMRLDGLLVFVAGQQCGDGQIFFSLEFMIPTCVYGFCCLYYVLDESPANFCKSGVIVCRDDSRRWSHGEWFKIHFSFPTISLYLAKLLLQGISQNTCPWVIPGAGSPRELQYNHIPASSYHLNGPIPWMNQYLFSESAYGELHAGV